MRFRAALFVALATFVTRDVIAQTHDAVGAEALFREGRAAADAGKFEVACPKFAASYRLDATQGTLFNLADCEERSGQLANAWQHFHQLLDQLPPNDDRRSYVETHSAALEKRVPRLRIVSQNAPREMEIRRDGVPLGDALVNVPLPVDAGSHRVVVHAPGRVDKTYDVTLAEGEARDLEITVGPAAPIAIDVGVATATHAPRGRTIGFVVAGVGIVSAGVGAVFGGLALSDNGQSNTDCANGVCADQHAVDLHEHAKTEALVADFAIFGGAALFAVGAVLVLTSHTTTMRVGFAPRGISLGGTF